MFLLRTFVMWQVYVNGDRVRVGTEKGQQKLFLMAGIIQQMYVCMFPSLISHST
jgi:hypothetical protein